MTRLKYPIFFLCLLLIPCLQNPLFAAGGRDSLPAELRSLDIKEEFLPSAEKEVGSIQEISGKGRLVVIHGGTQQACYARKGNPVYEKDILHTLEDCRIRIEFKDQNIIMMAPSTQLSIEEVSVSMMKGEKASRFSMLKGQAIFYAIRLFRYPSMKMELKTSTAAVGIRGTKFGAEIETEIELTRVYVFEGELEVSSLIDGRAKPLRENEVLAADRRGLGDVQFDPDRTKRFLENVIGEMATTNLPDPRPLDKNFYQQEMERQEKMIDMRQRELGPGSGHDLQRGGSSPSR